ncbi:hypothetical protein FPZ12_038230 [Amycolatopsis acidicola]|uniref:Antibiotic biosynthesis monooxygenase n=1 Tax=Amycolatopsis acidicola TaxID=2596893 RepID=A0A5N0UNI1_9PSEU|nr:hypothetical protein [Amycolatopsis acidicola]KAA9151767.1 hypothetical protein FPZ12_038230 [Amycolatopsis acidicola]
MAEVLLAVVVDMVAGREDDGQRFEDDVLARLGKHGGTLERRLRTADAGSEVHLLRFTSRAGYEAFLADPDRLALRDKVGHAAPAARVLEVKDV